MKNAILDSIKLKLSGNHLLNKLLQSVKQNNRPKILDTEASLLNLTECFDSLHTEATPGCKLLNNFPDCISFYPCNHLSLKDCKTHLQSLDCLCLEASSFPSTFVIVTDAGVIPSRCIYLEFRPTGIIFQGSN